MAANTPDAYNRAIVWKQEDAGAMGAIDSMDEQQFQAIHEQTARPILAYLIGVTGRRDVADDVLQETYCRYLVKQPRGMDASETRRYLFRIATNLLHDRWRRKEEAQLPESYEGSASGDVDIQLDVRRAMRALKPRDRELLWLAYVEGMNHAEIASATGLSAMSIRLLLFRARRRAAALLRPKEESQ
jgi:RNA polymerase sigma-70 factor (ECF subfamily)